MEQKQLEQMLDKMGITYTHTATKPTAQVHPSQGRYTMTGDWVETEFTPQVTDVGVKIDSIPEQPGVCEHCNLVVDKHPVIQIKCKSNRFMTPDWKIKCVTCKKSIEYTDYRASQKPADK
jgi:hypothetical protein